MSNAERVRKQVYELTAEDLSQHLIWEFCPDEEGEEGQDEATVKPSDAAEVPGYSPGVYIVACDVVFADHSSAIGYIYSGEPNNFGCIQPNVLAPSGQVNLWLGWLRYLKDPAMRAAKAMTMLHKDPTAIFPARFRTKASINGEPMEVTVDAFMAKGADQKLTEPSYVLVKIDSPLPDS